MRAWYLTETNGLDSYSFGELETPEPGSGEARVKL